MEICIKRKIIILLAAYLYAAGLIFLSNNLMTLVKPFKRNLSITKTCKKRKIITLFAAWNQASPLYPKVWSMKVKLAKTETIYHKIVCIKRKRIFFSITELCFFSLCNDLMKLVKPLNTKPVYNENLRKIKKY